MTLQIPSEPLNAAQRAQFVLDIGTDIDTLIQGVPSGTDIDIWLIAKGLQYFLREPVGQPPVCRKGSAQGPITAAADVSDMAIDLPVGTHHFELSGAYRTSIVTGGMQLAVAFSGTQTAIDYTLQQHTALGASVGDFASAANTFVGANGVGPGGTDVPFVLRGSIVVTVAGTLQLRAQATGLLAPTATIQRGSGFALKQPVS